MSSPSSATYERAGWSARQNSGGGQKGMEAPRTGERKRRGRGVDVMTFPTPPHSRQNTQLPTPETVRQPRKSAPISGKVAQPSVSFLPTPQTLPRQRASLNGTSSTRALSPSGQTTFIHSATTTEISTGAAVPRRRPGLTFAQQMGLLSSAVASTSVAVPGTFGGRLGVGVGMGGGHKSAHRGVDVIPLRPAEKEEENPFYVSPTTRPSKGPAASPRSVLRSSTKAMMDEEATDGSEEDEMAGPSSPLAGRSPLFPSIAKPSPSKRAKLTPPQPSTSRIPSTPSRTTLAPAPHLPPSPTRRSPRQAAKSAQLSRMRDEAHNPFLSRPSDFHVPTPAGEDEADRPYVTYVFRGSKKVFANPFTRPDLPFPPAELRPEDPEYEEHPCPKPRLLWPSKAPQAEMEEEVTPSPPSSPIRTPRTNRKSRFLNADRSLDQGMFDPPAEVYSDSEEERERVVGVAVRGKKGVRRVDSEDEGAEPVVRRGLLFGPSATATAGGSGVKRGADEGVGRDGKKARTLRM